MRPPDRQVVLDIAIRNDRLKPRRIQRSHVDAKVASPHRHTLTELQAPTSDTSASDANASPFSVTRPG